MSELGQEARDLIERALRDEPPADAAELVRIRRRVLAASAGASVFGVVGKAMAVLGKASVGPILKAFGVGVAVTVVAIGLPMVLSSEPRQKHAAVASLGRPSQPKVVSQNVGHGVREPSSELANAAAVPAPQQPHAVGFGVSAPVSNRAAPAPVLESAASASPPAVRAIEESPIPAPAAMVAPASTAFADSAGRAQSFSVPSAPGNPHRSSPLVQELTLLENVQSELRAGHGALALKLLDGSSFPEGGQLQAERLAAEVFASCQAGNSKRARAAARLFLSRYPSSPASGRVRGSCGGEEVGNAR